ncbi:MAG: ABC transporter substrate-binding protein, partial [Bifidobacteriaceae bacterium]|nr:ABC transporter substrate-binding protein [Bifidobacteriaceae bacterium]
MPFTSTVKRSLAWAAAAAAAAPLFAGCADSDGASQDGAGKVTTISFLSWDGEEVMGPLVKAFEDANPDIKVEFSWAPPVME